MKRIIRGFVIGLLCLFMALCFAGCKKNDPQSYIDAVAEFNGKLATYDAKINNINTKDPQCDTELLKLLEELEGEFKKFAEAEPPKGYSGAKLHAQNASDYMSQAVAYYRTAFEKEEIDQIALSSARVQYENAFIEIKNVGVALQNGE